MSDREEAMRAQEVYRCPVWCAQPDDEEQHEEHFSDWSRYENADGEHFATRKRLSWHDPANSHIEVATLGEGGTVNLTLAEMNAIVMDVLYSEERALENFDERWAYDGAEADETGDIYADEDYEDEDEEDEEDGDDDD